MGSFQIETSQNIKINQNIASLGSRFGALLLDFAIIYFYFTGIIMVVGIINKNNPDLTWYKTTLIVASIPVVFYHLLFEYFMNGQTPGKKMLKIQVVKTDGSSAGFIAYLIRWLFRIVDIQISFGIVAIVTYYTNGKGQRLGDIVADTTVVKLASTYKSRNVFIKIDKDYIPTYPHVTLFSDEDIMKIKELYIKARRNKDWDLLKKLRERIEEKLNIETNKDDIEFVKTIVKDYYYYYYNENETSQNK